MRFLFGLCTGALLLLWLAGDPGGQIERAFNLGVPWLSQRLELLRAPVERPDTDAVSTAVAVGNDDAPAPPQATIAADAASPTSAERWPDDAPLPEAFGDEYAWWGHPQDTQASHPDPVDRPDAAPTGAAALPAVEDGAGADRRATDATPAVDLDAVAVEPVTGIADLSAPVWIPFHSERSAAGFAQRLARALDHRFEVRKDGPGRYQVIFPYEDEAGRDALLARVAMLTGSRP